MEGTTFEFVDWLSKLVVSSAVPVSCKDDMEPSRPELRRIIAALVNLSGVALSLSDAVISPLAVRERDVAKLEGRVKLTGEGAVSGAGWKRQRTRSLSVFQ